MKRIKTINDLSASKISLFQKKKKTKNANGK